MSENHGTKTYIDAKMWVLISADIKHAHTQTKQCKGTHSFPFLSLPTSENKLLRPNVAFSLHHGISQLP